MTWANRKTRINTSLKREFFDSGIYTCCSGTEQKNATIDKGVRRYGSEASLSIEHDEITFLKTDIPNPKRDDTFFDGTETFTFVSAIIDDDQVAIWLVKNNG
jgi:hypothetical protein